MSQSRPNKHTHTEINIKKLLTSKIYHLDEEKKARFFFGFARKRQLATQKAKVAKEKVSIFFAVTLREVPSSTLKKKTFSTTNVWKFAWEGIHYEAVWVGAHE